ncbi:hypothetical protein QQF64_000951 [Cirrhinus molitorella]|uniref:Secreted protein n=1 Tax=Cirrhinus molitorella TaxID=172907 RepID=A0ABR3NYM1_9TELE
MCLRESLRSWDISGLLPAMWLAQMELSHCFHQGKQRTRMSGSHHNPRTDPECCKRCTDARVSESECVLTGWNTDTLQVAATGHMA